MALVSCRIFWGRGVSEYVIRLANFHGLWHSLITNLSRANVSPKTAQMLARHSDISLTMQIYTHVAPVEQAAAIRALPGLGDLRKMESRDDFHYHRLTAP